ncbi:MAG: NnrU family protein [Pseudomonadota bacterium]
MLAWSEFVLALGFFFASHSVPLRPSVRGPVTAWIGARSFGLGYSILSIAVLAWLIVAAGRAPYVELWPRHEWQSWAPVIAMFAVCLILGFGLGRPNPLSFGGARNERFDPKRPGLIAWTRHPVLAALTLWTLAHMLPNGDLAHAILFGLFGIFSILGGHMIDRRKRRDMGDAAWRSLIADIRQGDRLAGWGSVPEIAVRGATTVGAYALLILLHPIVLGVPPLP